MTEPTAHPGTHHNAPQTPQSAATDDDRDWTASAACREMDTDLFYEAKQGSQQPAARAVCARCPVILACFEWAMATEGAAARQDRYGVWGGQTPSGRSRFHTERVRAAAGKKPDPVSAAELRRLARKASGADAFYLGDKPDKTKLWPPVVGSRWQSRDRRSPGRVVEILDVTDEQVLMLSVPPAGAPRTTLKGRRSRIRATDFLNRYALEIAPAQLESPAPEAVQP